MIHVDLASFDLIRVVISCCAFVAMTSSIDDKGLVLKGIDEVVHSEDAGVMGRIGSSSTHRPRWMSVEQGSLIV